MVTTATPRNFSALLDLVLKTLLKEESVSGKMDLMLNNTGRKEMHSGKILDIVDTSQKPHSAVIIALDGCRYDYIERFHTPNIQSLIRNGVSFCNAVASNCPALTAPGYASISTGAFIRDHGIFTSLEWYDKASGNLRYFFDEEKGVMDLEHPTITDLIKARNPAAKVASVSTKDRNALLLAGNRADIIAYSYREHVFERQDVKEAYSGAGVHPDHYAWATISGRELPSYLKDLRLPRTVDWKGKGFEHPGADAADTSHVDRFIMECALEILEKEEPVLLIIGLVSSNITAHAHTPDSPEVEDAMLAIDQEIGRLIEKLKTMGRFDDTLIVMSSDHGMTVRPFGVDLLKELKARDYEDVLNNILYLYSGDVGGVYIEDISPPTIDRTIRAIESVEHIKGAWYKYDPRAPWFIQRTAHYRAPDIIIIPEKAWAIFEPGWEKLSFLSGHGPCYPSDSSILLIFSGPGVKKLGTVGTPLDYSSCELITDSEIERLPEQVDIVPTMESIMGLFETPS